VDGFARNFAQGSTRGRNHLFQILCRSVQGFRNCERSNFAVLHWLSRSPLTQGCATARLWQSNYYW